MKLNVPAFALAFGLVWGLGLFLMTWWLIFNEGAAAAPTFIGRVYLGYTVSPLGSVIGLAWGLADGAIGAAVFAWLYNLLVRCSSKAPRGQKADEAESPE